MAEVKGPNRNLRLSAQPIDMIVALLFLNSRVPITGSGVDACQVKTPHFAGNHFRTSVWQAVEILKPLMKALTQPSQLVLDPFAGLGSTLTATALVSRSYLGVEQEVKYCELVKRSLVGVSRYMRASA